MNEAMRSFCKDMLGELLYRTGYYDYLKKAYLGGTRRGIILCYHRVKDDSVCARTDGSWHHSFELGVSLSNFRAQMEFLRRHMTPVPLSDIQDFIEGGPFLPENAVAVTFDDGYQDSYTVAYPILCQYEIPATIFVTTGLIETGRLNWWDSLFEIVRRTTKARLDLRSIRAFGESRKRDGAVVLALDSVQGRESACNLLMQLLRSVPDHEREPAVAMVRRELEVEDGCDARDLMLSWTQMRAMAEELVEFGAHTVTHPCLSRLPLKVAEMEIGDSKASVEAHLKRPVVGFAYPYGEYNDQIKSLVKGKGFKYACSSLYGTVSHKSDGFELPRVGLTEAVPSRIAHRLVAALRSDGIQWTESVTESTASVS